MPTPTNPTGFDAFFQSITNSPEFRAFSKAKDSISDLASLEASLASMQADVDRASSMMKNLDAKFDTPPSLDKEGQGDLMPKNV